MTQDKADVRSYRFATKPRWLFVHVFVLGAVITFAAAGFWQLRRLQERRDHNERVQAALREDPARADDGDLPEAYHRVEVRGRYDTSNEVVVRARTFDGRPGNHVLTPLLVDDDVAVVINRGWVPADVSDPPLRDAEPPDGEVTVTGIVLESEQKRPFAPDDPTGDKIESFGRVNLPRLADQLPYEIAPRYVLLEEQEPERSGDLPRIVPLGDPTEGSHLAYSIQWFLFIPIALAVYVTLLRRESRKGSAVAGV